MGRRVPDSLHAAYLEIVERSVLDDLTSGHYDRGNRRREAGPGG